MFFTEFWSKIYKRMKEIEGYYKLAQKCANICRGLFQRKIDAKLKKLDVFSLIIICSFWVGNLDLAVIFQMED